MAPKQVSSDADVNDSATTSEEFHSDSTQSVKKMPLAATNSSIMLAIHDLEQSLQEHGDKISQLQRNINRVLESNMKSRNNPSYVEIMIIIFLLGFFQAVFVYFF
jgi:TolA-binding protein